MKFILPLVLLTMLGLGCDDSGTSPVVPKQFYAPPTEPESLIANLQTAYRRREIPEYAKLLGGDYKFKFQPIDANTIGKQFWTRTEDSTGTAALFKTTEVSQIRLSLTYSRRDTTVDHSPPVDSLRIRIQTTDLQVDQTDGTTWVVDDQQDFFFRKGRPANKENPNHWLIYEWDDLPSLGVPRLSGGAVTWGLIKVLYEGTLP